MALFKWENFSALDIHPRVSFFQNNTLGDFVDNTSTGATGPVNLEIYRGATGATGPKGATGALNGGLGGLGGVGGAGGLGSTGPILIIDGVATQYIGGTGATGATGPRGDTGRIIPCIPSNPTTIVIENIQYDENGSMVGFTKSIGGMSNSEFTVSVGTYSFHTQTTAIAIISSDPNILQTWQSDPQAFTSLYDSWVDGPFDEETGQYTICKMGRIDLNIYYPFTIPFRMIDNFGNLLFKIYYSDVCNSFYDNKSTIPPTLNNVNYKIREYPNGIAGTSSYSRYYLVNYDGTLFTNVSISSTFYTPMLPSDPIEMFPPFPSFPFINGSDTQIVVGMYYVQAEGEYKLKRLAPNTYGLNNQQYFGIVDYLGNLVTRFASDNVLVCNWNGTDEFPFGRFGRDKFTLVQYQDIEYTIVGVYNETSTIKYMLKQPLLGTYANDTTYYNIVTLQTNQLVYDPFTTNSSGLVVVNWQNGVTIPFNQDVITSTTNNGILYNIVSNYSITLPDTYKIKQQSVNSNIYKLVTLSGNTVNDPGTNNQSIVTIQWNGTDAFPFTATAYSGYRVIRYIIIGIYDITEAPSYLIKQNVVDDSPSMLYKLVDSEGTEIKYANTDILIQYNNQTFPLFLSPTYSASPKYRITGIYSVIQGNYRIKITNSVYGVTSTSNVYDIIKTDLTYVLDEGTGNTSNVLITWDGVETFPFEKFSNSGYTYIKYKIIGIYDATTILTSTGPTGPSSGGDTGPTDSLGVDLGDLFPIDTYTPDTGPTGPYTGPESATPPVDGPDETGPAITNTLGSSITLMIGGQSGVFVLTQNSDLTKMFTVQ